MRDILKIFLPIFLPLVIIGCSNFGAFLAGFRIDKPSWWLGFFAAAIAIFSTTIAVRMFDDH